MRAGRPRATPKLNAGEERTCLGPLLLAWLLVTWREPCMWGYCASARDRQEAPEPRYDLMSAMHEDSGIFGHA
jgi:hypothetical protein